MDIWSALLTSLSASLQRQQVPLLIGLLQIFFNIFVHVWCSWVWERSLRCSQISSGQVCCYVAAVMFLFMEYITTGGEVFRDTSEDSRCSTSHSILHLTPQSKDWPHTVDNNCKEEGVHFWLTDIHAFMILWMSVLPLPQISEGLNPRLNPPPSPPPDIYIPLGKIWHWPLFSDICWSPWIFSYQGRITFNPMGLSAPTQRCALWTRTQDKNQVKVKH